MGRELKFNIEGIRTPQFAIFESDYDSEDHNIEMASNYSYGVDLEACRFVAMLSLSFLQKKRIVLKIETHLTFAIEKLSFDSLIEDGKFVMPLDDLRIFTALLYGTSRGVLAEKLADSLMAKIILPPVDINEVITHQLEISLS